MRCGSPRGEDQVRVTRGVRFGGGPRPRDMEGATPLLPVCSATGDAAARYQRDVAKVAGKNLVGCAGPYGRVAPRVTTGVAGAVLASCSPSPSLPRRRTKKHCTASSKWAQRRWLRSSSLFSRFQKTLSFAMGREATVSTSMRRASRCPSNEERTVLCSCLPVARKVFESASIFLAPSCVLGGKLTYSISTN